MVLSLNSLRLLALILAALGLVGCAGMTGAVQTEYREVEVAVRAPCPDDETFARLMAEKPIPIRDQSIPKPDTPEGELAVVKPQLGRYEAPDAWADKTTRVLTDCNQRQPLDPP